jgi:hypothetical protein
MAELTALGTVTTMGMEQWAIRSQVLSRVQTCADMDAVHRLNGGGWSAICALRLRYSQALARVSRIIRCRFSVG